MKRYKMTITILSPVHIGSGQQIDPLEYLVKDTIFYRLDTARFLSTLTANLKAKFNEALKSSNPVTMREFIVDNLDTKKYSLFSAATGPDFEKAYKDNVDSINNQLLVELFPRCGTQLRAYLPGSSIKGAIRTAVVSQLAKPGISPAVYTDDRGQHPYKSGTRLEKYILRCKDAKQDPFKMLRIADAFLPDDATFIDLAQIYKRDRAAGAADPGKIQIFCEQCFSMLDNERITAEGMLEINTDLIGKKGVDRRGNSVDAVSMPLTAEQILNSCKAFYLPKMDHEHKVFYDDNPQLRTHSQKLLDVKYADNECPIRIGRFCHVECHTLDNYREPKTRRGWGKTRTLSAGTMPMGWVKMRLDEMK